ncbi:MAG: aminotransferase class V-fold PLP-dependent enzyme [Alphaproteobacteria bacterium]|nr:aminotransferase class V-fold PLP-dependent enzyme [Alphaproteobacteria bacterium]
MTERAYLDWNASAPLRPEASDVMRDLLSLTGNASSVHAEGRKARAAIERARLQVAELVGAAPGDVIFTSGATEANNLALRGLIGAGAETGERITRLFVSAIEHDSVRAVAAALAVQVPGLRVSEIPVGAGGRVDLTALRSMLMEGKGRALLSVMAANNETGVIQPIAEIAALAHEADALLHCDAAQAPGRIAIDRAAWGIDALSLSAHKIGGPQGAGALVVGADRALQPQLLGGGQEANRRAGTQNALAIAGFGAAAAAAMRDLADIDGLAARRDGFEAALRRADPGITIYGEGAPRLANTSCIGLAGQRAETAVIALDLAGIAVSAGSACSSGKVRTSHVLAAMGVNAEAAGEAIRISFGPTTTDEEIGRAINAILAHRQNRQPKEYERATAG